MIIRVLCFAVLLSFVGLTHIYFLYEYSWSSPWILVAKLILSFSIVSLFVYMWVRDGERIKGFKAFSSFYVAVLAIVCISTSINFTTEYLLYNHWDKDYKFKKEKRVLEAIARHRDEKGLPPPIPMADQEIEEKYGFNGLINTYKTNYVVNFFYTFLFYPIALLLWYLVEPEQDDPEN